MSTDYKNMFNLVSHHEERNVGDVFHRAMFSIMMLRYPKYRGWTI